MKPYVFIGFNALFGAYADIVHVLGGIVRKVVINLPMETNTGFHTFQEQLDRYHRWLDSAGMAHRVEVEHLRDFRPAGGDHHILASRGLRLLPLCEYVTGRLGVQIEPLVAPSATVSPTVRLPEGVIIRAGASVGAEAELGRFCAIGVNCHVGHDVVVEPFCDLAPNVNLSAGTRVRRGARIGIGATVINNVTIGEQARVAAGAVVIRDVEPLTLVAGVPAVFKKALAPAAVPEGVPGLP